MLALDLFYYLYSVICYYVAATLIFDTIGIKLQLSMLLCGIFTNKLFK